MPHPSKKSKDNVVDVEPVKTTKDDREKFRTQEERRSEKFAIPIDESQYPQGNFDVVSAARAAELTYDELVAVVHATEDTMLTCHPIIEDTLFDLISNQNDDGNKAAMETVEVKLPRLQGDDEAKSMPSMMMVPTSEGRSVVYAIRPDAEPESTVEVAIPTPGNAAFNFQQLLAAAGSRDVRQLIRATEARSLIRVLKKTDGELNRENIQAFIDVHDINDSGVCEKQEWSFLFGQLRKEQIEFCIKMVLLKGNMYQGLGMTPCGDQGDKRMVFKACGVDVMTLFSCSANCPSVAGWLMSSCFQRGFLSDLTYYTANNHPLGVMLFSDPLHPFDESERQADFAAALATSFFGAALMVFVRDWDAVAKVFISALFITVPSSIIKKISYYLFAQPCLVYDESKSSASYNAVIDQCAALATACGKLLVVIWSLVFIGLGIFIWAQAWESSELAYWAYGLIQFWFVWFLKIIALPFNPSALVFENIAPVWNKYTCGLVPLSIWFVERERVQATIREKVKSRGLQQFTMPGEPQGPVDDNGASAGDVEAPETSNASPMHNDD